MLQMLQVRLSCPCRLHDRQENLPLRLPTDLLKIQLPQFRFSAGLVAHTVPLSQDEKYMQAMLSLSQGTHGWQL